jgi:hypothetical protein
LRRRESVAIPLVSGHLEGSIQRAVVVPTVEDGARDGSVRHLAYLDEIPPPDIGAIDPELTAPPAYTVRPSSIVMTVPPSRSRSTCWDPSDDGSPFALELRRDAGEDADDSATKVTLLVARHELDGACHGTADRPVIPRRR